MGADFHIHSKKLKIKGTFVQKVRVQNQISSKTVGAKSVFLKICGCSCTHTNEGPEMCVLKLSFCLYFEWHMSNLKDFCPWWPVLLFLYIHDVASNIETFIEDFPLKQNYELKYFFPPWTLLICICEFKLSFCLYYFKLQMSHLKVFCPWWTVLIVLFMLLLDRQWSFY